MQDLTTALRFKDYLLPASKKQLFADAVDFRSAGACAAVIRDGFKVQEKKIAWHAERAVHDSNGARLFLRTNRH